MTILYYTFLYSYPTYCVEVRGSTFNKYLATLFKKQKRAIRMIDVLPNNHTTDDSFICPNLLNLNNIYLYCVSLFMLKFVKGT